MVAWDEDRSLVEAILECTPQPSARGSIGRDPNYPETLRRRIARRVVVDDEGCWVWQGSLNRKGYGMMGAFGDKGAYAHRVSYSVFIDETPIPAGYSIDHLCRTRACVNPFHLEVVPHAENVRRGNTGSLYRDRTHCEHRHPFDEENTGWRSDGTGRLCRQCRRESDRRAKARRKTAMA